MEFNRLLSSAISAYGEPNLKSIKNKNKNLKKQKKLIKKILSLITEI